jgi:hypothetical protein
MNGLVTDYNAPTARGLVRFWANDRDNDSKMPTENTDLTPLRQTWQYSWLPVTHCEFRLR